MGIIEGNQMISGEGIIHRGSTDMNRQNTTERKRLTMIAMMIMSATMITRTTVRTTEMVTRISHQDSKTKTSLVGISMGISHLDRGPLTYRKKIPGKKTDHQMMITGEIIRMISGRNEPSDPASMMLINQSEAPMIDHAGMTGITHRMNVTSENQSGREIVITTARRI